MRARTIDKAGQVAEKNSDFFGALAVILRDNLEPLLNQNLNRTLCIRVYTSIFDTVREAIQQSKVEFSNESLNYLCQQIYDGIVVNGNQELDPDIFTPRAKLENIRTGELALMALMLKNTDFAIPIIQEIKKRS